MNYVFIAFRWDETRKILPLTSVPSPSARQFICSFGANRFVLLSEHLKSSTVFGSNSNQIEFKGWFFSLKVIFFILVDLSA